MEYNIGQDKVLVHTSTKLIEGWEACKDTKVLQTYARGNSTKEEGLKWVGPKIPKALMAEAFALMGAYPDTEISFVLYINLQDSTWFFKVPKQNGYAASVSYKDDGAGVPAGYCAVGTIHTHPNMGAFWSGTDHNDQKGTHGLHMVFGLKDGYPDSWKVTIFTTGAQYDIDLLDVLEEMPKKDELPEARKDWLDILKERLEVKTTPQYSFSGHGGYSGGYTPNRYGINWDDYDYGYDYYGHGRGYGYRYNGASYSGSYAGSRYGVRQSVGYTGGTYSYTKPFENTPVKAQPATQPEYNTEDVRISCIDRLMEDVIKEGLLSLQTDLDRVAEKHGYMINYSGESAGDATARLTAAIDAVLESDDADVLDEVLAQYGYVFDDGEADWSDAGDRQESHATATCARSEKELEACKC